MKVKSESEVAQSCETLSNPMDCSLPGSSVHGIFQARVLEWGAIASPHIHTTIYKIDNQQGPYCIAQGTLLNILYNLHGKESEKKWIYVCV